MFLVHITNPKSFVFNFWGSLHIPAAVFMSYSVLLIPIPAYPTFVRFQRLYPGSFLFLHFLCISGDCQSPPTFVRFQKFYSGLSVNIAILRKNLIIFVFYGLKTCIYRYFFVPLRKIKEV